MFSFIFDIILNLSLEAVWNAFSHGSAIIFILKFLLRKLPFSSLKKLKEKKDAYRAKRILAESPECPRCKAEGLPDIRCRGELPLGKYKMPFLEYQLLKLASWIWPDSK